MSVKMNSIWFSIFMFGLVIFGCNTKKSEEIGPSSAPDVIEDTRLADGECRKDTDCGDLQLCLAGKCLNLSSAGADSDDSGDESDSTDGRSTVGTADSADATDGVAGLTSGSDGQDGSGLGSDGTDGLDGVSGSTAGQGSGQSCETSSDCPNDEFCCDIGFGGYCEAEASACYGPECNGDADCGDGRECCPAQAGLPAYCAPTGGCYGPTCAQDSDCGAGRECCPIDFVDNICGPVGQCIGKLCSSDSDCDGSAECCPIEIFGQNFSVCLLGSLCAIAQEASGGGGAVGSDGATGSDGANGSAGSDGQSGADGSPPSGYSCDGVCGEFQQGWPCQCTGFCAFVPGGCCEDYESVCEGSGDGTDGGEPVSACQSSDECGTFAVCCPQGDGSNACQSFCPCSSGADCVDLGCCITDFVSACIPQNICFAGTYDPPAP